MPEWSGWLAALARDNRVTRLQTPQATLWVAAERLAQFRALWPDGALSPDDRAAADEAQREWSRDEALAEILRGRLEGMGPVDARRAGSAARTGAG